jgi:1-acyl-sn-glycerol-3-phosphate acyltransferase
VTTPEINALRRTLTDEIVHALGLSKTGFWRKALAPLLWFPSDRVARFGADFEEHVVRHGFRAAAAWAVEPFVQKILVSGQEHIPREGPLLIASNHPGSIDGLAIAAKLPRDDFRAIVSSIPFIQSLPGASRHMIFTSLDPHARMRALREAIRHLEKNGTLLLFPSGVLDPDPALLPGAQDALERWSDSISLILRRVPETQVVVTIVSGVLESRFWNNPLTHLAREFWKRQRLAEFIQTIQQILRPGRFQLVPRLTFDQPLHAQELLLSTERRIATQALVQRAQAMIETHRTP